MRAVFVSAILGLLCLSSGPAHAAIEAFSIQHSETVPCGKVFCTELRGRLLGTAPGGAFDVPFRMLFPADSARRNGVALVDVANTTAQTMIFFDTFDDPAPQFFAPHFLARQFLGDAYLGERGYLYFGVTWDLQSLFICALSGHEECAGEMALATDGYWIVKYAGDFLKDPPAGMKEAWGEVVPEKAIVFGFSQSAYLLQQIYKREPMDMPYDGVLLGGTDLTCTALVNDPPGWTFETFCEGEMPESSGRTIVVNTESDVQAGGQFIRGESPWYRVYEVAGTAHVFTGLFDLREFGALRQNPADPTPVFRAMVEGLRAWLVEAEEPPPSALLEMTGEVEFFDLFPTFPGLEPVFGIARDAEGICATGGVRLPHCPGSGEDFRDGAPLGRYNGIETEVPWEPDYAFRSIFIPIGGTFEPFSEAELEVRYPQGGDYPSRVSHAAHTAWKNGWILQEDRAAYLRAAQGMVSGSRRDTSDRPPSR